MTLVVAAALVDDLVAPAMLLAARRSYPPELAGRWEFPGGKVHDGEAPVAALHRELAEELGVEAVLDAEIAGPDGGPWPLTGAHVMRLWLGQITAGVPDPRGAHDALRWVDLADLHRLPWLVPDRPIVAELQRRWPP